MNIQTIFVLQIIADFLFCLVIVFLLARLRKSFDKTKPPVVDDNLLLELQTLITRSQSDSERFLADLDESCRRFQQLAVSLESSGKRVASLLEEIDLRLEQVSIQKQHRPVYAGDKDYTAIARLLGRDLSVEEIAERTGIPSGEISLVADLEKIKKTESS